MEMKMKCVMFYAKTALLALRQDLEFYFFGWTIFKADVKAAFLQTGEAQRDVYVLPPKENQMKFTHL